jgi:hypothetical protein
MDGILPRLPSRMDEARRRVTAVRRHRRTMHPSNLLVRTDGSSRTSAKKRT